MTTVPTQAQYEANKWRMLQKQLAEIEAQPKIDALAAFEELKKDIKDSRLIAERVSWLLDGNYGYGAMKEAQKVLAMGKSANKPAALTNLIGALEWRCKRAHILKAWKALTSAEQSALTVALDKVIFDYMAEHTENK